MGVNLSRLVQVTCLFKSANLDDYFLLQTGEYQKSSWSRFPRFTWCSTTQERARLHGLINMSKKNAKHSCLRQDYLIDNKFTTILIVLIN